MTRHDAQLLERALINTVESELTVMQSLCDVHFPCDLSTTIAMRMSRSVVSAICRTGIRVPGSNSSAPVSTQTASALNDAQEQIERLSYAFERKLSNLPADGLEWQTWKA